MSEHLHQGHPTPGARYARWVFSGFLIVAAYFLFMEHRAHVIQYLPFLLVLACPLMHLFHRHGGHGTHGGHGSRPSEKPDESRP